ncbi:hypothetical protein CDIK_1527 [Cucumispora dikerogammari]|nr:hypothetical protein CDIK_1527 [Cucumispora dikerogammari]
MGGGIEKDVNTNNEHNSNQNIKSITNTQNHLLNNLDFDNLLSTASVKTMQELNTNINQTEKANPSWSRQPADDSSSIIEDINEDELQDILSSFSLQCTSRVDLSLECNSKGNITSQKINEKNMEILDEDIIREHLNKEINNKYSENVNIKNTNSLQIKLKRLQELNAALQLDLNNINTKYIEEVNELSKQLKKEKDSYQKMSSLYEFERTKCENYKDIIKRKDEELKIKSEQIVEIGEYLRIILHN